MSNMQIVIRYRRHNEVSLANVALTPMDYYELEKDEIPNMECLPMHDHAYLYLGIPLMELAETRVEIESGPEKCTIRETFWGNGRNCLIERRDQGQNPYHLVVICTEIESDPKCEEIIRMHEDVSGMVVDSHVVIETLSDGSQRQKDLLFPNDSF